MGQCANTLVFGPTKTISSKAVAPFRSLLKTSMEALINHFEVFNNSQTTEPAEAYCGIEAPKGEFGTYLAVEGGSVPYRCKIRSPGFLHLQSLDFMTFNHFLADVTTVVGTQDIVFGEVDR